MALTTLTGQVNANVSWQATLAVSGFQAIPDNDAVKKSLSIVLGAAIANGCNQAYASLQSLTASASVSIDLTAITNVLQQASVVLVRVKAIIIILLATTDTAPDGTAGTAASSINIDNTVTNALSSQAGTGWFANAAEGAANGSKFCIPNGGMLLFATPVAAGIAVDGTHKILKLTNNDGAVTAKILVGVLGADA